MDGDSVVGIKAINKDGSELTLKVGMFDYIEASYIAVQLANVTAASDFLNDAIQGTDL